MSFAAVNPCVAPERVFIVVAVYFVIISVRKLLDTPSYVQKFIDCYTTVNFKIYKNCYVLKI